MYNDRPFRGVRRYSFLARFEWGESSINKAGVEGRGMSKNVYARLRAEILSGKLPPGASLVEATIASRYRVSRTPIREALRRLEQDELVEQRDRGLAVRARSPEEILEIYSVRVVLEELVARSAAENRNELDLANLVERHARMVSVDRTHSDLMAATNQQFHEALWASSHNRVLVDLLARLNSYLARYPATTLSSPGRWENVLEDYRLLIDAIVNRDAEKASVISHDHMSAARDIRLRMLTSREGV